MEEEKTTLKRKFGKFHDKHYKHLLLIPFIIIILSFFFMFVFYQQHGDFINKDISLSGGTSVTLYENVDSAKIVADLSGKLDEISTRDIFDIITNKKIAVIIQTKSSGDETKKALEQYLGHQLDGKNSSFEFTGPSISQSFYNQLLVAMLIAFTLMSIVVFAMFRTFVPSFAVILSAFADILMTLVFVDILGVKVSSAGIVAFLMLIGYSVDTDILLTNRVLRVHDIPLNEKLFKAFKTGITMTITAIAAVSIALFVSFSFSVVLGQIFLILLIGLFFDLLNTWVTNVSLLKWYAIKNEH